VKEVYIVATAEAEPVALEALKEAFESEEVQFVTGEEGLFFSVRSETSRVDVKFDARAERLGFSPEMLTGTEACHEALKAAKGFYRFSFEPGKPQGSVAVFEALWCVRTLLEHIEGVVLDATAFRLHTVEDITEITEFDFDIRDHMTLHAVEAGEGERRWWIHSHGLSKFGTQDVEVFNLVEEDLRPAETFFHELCTDLAFGQGPQLRTAVSTSVGAGFMILPSDEARRSLFSVPQETFEGHETLFNTVVSADGRHTLSEVLSQYRDRFEEETPEEALELKTQADGLLPAFKARFLRKGLMEPLMFLVRAPFEVNPERGDGPKEEQLWVEVLTWEDEAVIGKLVDGGQSTSEWRKGAHVEFEPDQINAIALSRDGRTLEDDEMKNLLVAEKPM
jgi:hypothetical protein